MNIQYIHPADQLVMFMQRIYDKGLTTLFWQPPPTMFSVSMRWPLISSSRSSAQRYLSASDS